MRLLRSLHAKLRTSRCKKGWGVCWRVGQSSRIDTIRYLSDTLLLSQEVIHFTRRFYGQAETCVHTCKIRDGWRLFANAQIEGILELEILVFHRSPLCFELVVCHSIQRKMKGKTKQKGFRVREQHYAHRTGALGDERVKIVALPTRVLVSRIQTVRLFSNGAKLEYSSTLQFRTRQ